MELTRLFPNLREQEFEITSPKDPRYNCIAWAAGDVKRWWWPAEPSFTYWPAGARREETVAGFAEAFSTLGYEIAESGELESGYEKLAIFALADGVPTHMARQQLDGSWTSKLGRLEDISHIHLAAVGGTDYGDVVVFLRRRPQ
jgi:hypothetical protein